MKARYALPVMLVTLVVGACGKKDSSMDSGYVGSVGGPVVANPSWPSTGNLTFDQQCASQGGQMISLSGQTVCRSPGVNTSLGSSYAVNLSLTSYTYPTTTSVPVRRGDTLRIQNDGTALTGYVYAYGTAAAQFTVSGSHVSLRNEDGYLGFYIHVPAGFSSVSLKLSQVRTERCFNSAGTFLQCP